MWKCLSTVSWSFEQLQEYFSIWRVCVQKLTRNLYQVHWFHTLHSRTCWRWLYIVCDVTVKFCYKNTKDKKNGVNSELVVLARSKYKCTFFKLIFLAFRLLLVLRGHSVFYPRHNGQWPRTSKDFPSQNWYITFIFLS